MNIRLADLGDLERLINLRLDFFRECFAPQSAGERDRLAEALRAYFEKHLGDAPNGAKPRPDRSPAAHGPYSGPGG